MQVNLEVADPQKDEPTRVSMVLIPDENSFTGLGGKRYFGESVIQKTEYLIFEVNETKNLQSPNGTMTKQVRINNQN